MFEITKMFQNGNMLAAQNQTTRREIGFYILLFALLWTYIVLRAIFTQLTHDETANFFRYVQTGNFQPYGPDTSATNHLLNSFLAWIFFSLFGAEAWALRLGNVLSFPFFFYFLVRIAAYIQRPFLRISFVVVLALTHNLIEFFAMSRGYGHSMALLLAALWFLLRAFHTVSVRDYFFTLLFASLALTANLTLLNSVLLMIGLLILRLITRQKMSFLSWWKHGVIVLFVGIVPVVFYANYLFYLKSLGDLYYGYTTGFWEVTVKSLVKTMVDPGYIIIEIFVGLYFAFILLAGLFLIAKNLKVEIFFQKHLLFFYLLTGNIAAVVLLKNMFGVNYPEDRTGLYFVVYFIGSIFFLADAMYQRYHKKKIFLFVLPVFVLPVHFFLNMNLSHNSFENQKIPDRFYEKMKEDFSAGEVPPSIGGYMGRALRWGFINYKNGGLLGKVQGNNYPDSIEDYQIADSMFPYAMAKPYDTVDAYENSKFYLLRRKSAALQSFVFEKSGISTGGETDQEYFRFFIFDADTLAGESVQVLFDLHITTSAKPFMAWLVVNSLDANNQQIGYEYYPLEWLGRDWDGAQGHIVNSMIVRVPQSIHQLNFYLWNKQKIPFSVNDGSVKVLKYTR